MSHIEVTQFQFEHKTLTNTKHIVIDGQTVAEYTHCKKGNLVFSAADAEKVIKVIAAFLLRQ